ncbi:MAG: DUF930 domain-containing protein [Rhizobium sp.]|nr:DUF930 domain-containing protein [Rhizobium sp.]
MIRMEKTSARRWRKLGGGLVVSILLHLMIFAVLFIEMPEPITQPEPEESVAVEIVPPPEEQEPEPPKAEEAQPEQQEPSEEEQADAPPAPPPQSVPAPPERPAEQPPVEQPPAEQPPEEAAADEPAPSLPLLRPVFEFGEKDSGPRQDTSGNAAEEAAKPAEIAPQENAVPAEEPEPEPPAEEAVEEADQTPATPLPDDIAVPEIDAASAGDESDGAQPAQQSDDTTVALTQDRPAEKPEQPVETPQAPDAAADEAVQAKTELDEVTKLYSTSLTGDSAAMTAMGDIPRPDRADQLCVTELREQLRNATPAYRPELLPSFQLKDGDVLTVNKAAFRANGQWFNLRFRCEIDPDATRVLSFAFEVGAAIPKRDWKRYGFPEF